MTDPSFTLAMYVVLVCFVSVVLAFGVFSVLRRRKVAEMLSRDEMVVSSTCSPELASDQMNLPLVEQTVKPSEGVDAKFESPFLDEEGVANENELDRALPPIVDAVCEGAEKEAVGITHDSAATRDSEQVMRQESVSGGEGPCGIPSAVEVRARIPFLELADDPMKNMLLSEFMPSVGPDPGSSEDKSHLGPVLNETSSNGVSPEIAGPIASDDLVNTDKEINSLSPQESGKTDDQENISSGKTTEFELKARVGITDGARTESHGLLFGESAEASTTQTSFTESTEDEYEKNNDTHDEGEISKIEETAEPGVARKLSPDRRGGAHRGQRKSDTNEIESSSAQRPRVRKPEIVCWYQYRKWFLGVETTDEYADQTDYVVTQDGRNLIKETDWRWILSNISSEVNVSSMSLSQSHDIRLGERSNPYLLFKLVGQHQKWGRRVQYATNGTFLVIVPETWTRKGESSGVPSAQCNLVGLRAHLANVDSTIEGRISFDTPDQSSMQIPNLHSKFELVGSLIEDANEAMGPLFGTHLPRLRCRDGINWGDISIVVIGEEGENHSGWRSSFVPKREVELQDLSPYFQARQSGWYFIRLYNTQEELVESLDFRFAMALSSINISQNNPMPGTHGHTIVGIDIQHSTNSSIKLNSPGHIQFKLDINEQGTRIEIPASPDSDNSEWMLLTQKHPKIELTFLIERVWWRLCDQHATHQRENWTDKTVVLSPHHLLATSKYSIKIRLPRKTKEIQVRFDQGTVRAYRVEVTQREVVIPLKHFEAAIDSAGFAVDHEVKLMIGNLEEQVIAVLPQQKEILKEQAICKASIKIRLDKRKLFKYMARLARKANQPAYSEMIKECIQNWMSPDAKGKRNECVIRSACLIEIGWGILKVRGIKPIGKRKGWVRNYITIANTNQEFLAVLELRYRNMIRDAGSI